MEGVYIVPYKVKFILKHCIIYNRTVLQKLVDNSSIKIRDIEALSDTIDAQYEIVIEFSEMGLLGTTETHANALMRPMQTLLIVWLCIFL